jgi:hypothetical protein
VRKHSNSVEWIIANTINETAQGDPNALAARIVAALGEAGYRIAPDELGAQPFYELKPEMRPQDPSGDGRGPSEPQNTAETSPTPCHRRSRRLMRRAAGRSMFRSPATARSSCRAGYQPNLLHNSAKLRDRLRYSGCGSTASGCPLISRSLETRGRSSPRPTRHQPRNCRSPLKKYTGAARSRLCRHAAGGSRILRHQARFNRSRKGSAASSRPSPASKAFCRAQRRKPSSPPGSPICAPSSPANRTAPRFGERSRR